MNKEIVYSTENFDVVKVDDKFGICPTTLSVAILPYTKDKRGLPEQLGVITEYNKVRSKESITVITGKAEGEDPDILTAARRKLFERSGMDVHEYDRWHFLGFLTTHKSVDQEIPCFSCDVTGLTVEEDPEEDLDTEEEEKIKEPDRTPKFVLMPVNQALDTSDCYIPSIFMKIFKLVFGFNSSEKTPADEPTTDATVPDTNTKEQEKIMDIPGVVGAGENDGSWKITIEPDSDETSIESGVRDILGDDATITIEKSTELTDKKDAE